MWLIFLGAEALHLEYPTKVVFDSVTVGLNEGDRIGIVGRNGDGKSTLLKLLSGRLEPDSGRITVRSGTRIGVLDQSDTLDDNQTVAHAVVGDRLEHEWAGDAKVRDVIGGLLADVPWEAMISSLSGGQRRRVQLAQLLVGDWDVICCDEPTNQAVVAFVILRADQEDAQTADEANGILRAHVAEQIGAIARPRHVYVVTELPKTRSGKIMRRLLRDVAEGRAVGDTTTLADTSVMQVISDKLSGSAPQD